MTTNLEEKIKEQESKVAELSQRMIKYDEEIKRLKKEVDERENLHRDAIFKLNDIKSEIAKAEDSLRQLIDAITDKHNEFMGLDQKREISTGEYLEVLEGHKENIGKKKEIIENLNSEIEELNSQIEDKKGVLKIEEQNLVSSNNAIKAQIKERGLVSDKIKAEIESLSPEKYALSKEIKELKESKDDLGLEVHSLNSELSSAKEENGELSVENERLSLAIEAINDELTGKKKEIADEESRLDDKKIENTKESDRLDAVRTSLNNKALEIRYTGMRLNKLIKKHRMEDEFKKIPV